MEHALQVQNHEPPPVEPISRDQIIKYLDTFGLTSELNDLEKEQFVEIAEAYQLNPFKREVYCVPYGEGEYRRLSIITGYEVFIKRAERTGKLDGWHAWVEGDSEDTFKAVIEIFRKDWSHPFQHSVYWKEAVQRRRDGSLTQFWKKMPRFQLRKVCISQGFRLCFPDELGGMPYDPSELPEEMTTVKVTPMPTSPIENQSDRSATVQESTHPAKKENPRLVQIREQLESNKDHFSENHLKWIESQLEINPSEDNLQKLEQHINEVLKKKTIVKPLKRLANTAKQQEKVQIGKPQQEPALIF
ncbi:MAG: phage recombination protein Bet [Spirochaetales bacterium]|nr:phage recombination protein Bet [Spirochaetales bacterium]